MSDNQVVGYDTISDGRKFPRFSGPCKGCGAVNYGLSSSGPDYCGACACGVDPKLSKCRRELEEMGSKYIDALLALSLLTGHKPSFNAKMKWRAEEFIKRFKADQDLNIGIGPDISGEA